MEKQKARGTCSKKIPLKSDLIKGLRPWLIQKPVVIDVVCLLR